MYCSENKEACPASFTCLYSNWFIAELNISRVCWANLKFRRDTPSKVINSMWKATVHS